MSIFISPLTFIAFFANGPPPLREIPLRTTHRNCSVSFQARTYIPHSGRQPSFKTFCWHQQIMPIARKQRHYMTLTKSWCMCRTYCWQSKNRQHPFRHHRLIGSYRYSTLTSLTSCTADNMGISHVLPHPHPQASGASYTVGTSPSHQTPLPAVLKFSDPLLSKPPPCFVAPPPWYASLIGVAGTKL